MWRLGSGVVHERQGVYTATELRQYRPFMGDIYYSSPSGPHDLEMNHPGLYWGKKHTVLIDIFCVIGIFFFDVVTLSRELWAALIPNPSPYVRSVEKVWQTIKLVSIMNSRTTRRKSIALAPPINTPLCGIPPPSAQFPSGIVSLQILQRPTPLAHSRVGSQRSHLSVRTSPHQRVDPPLGICWLSYKTRQDKLLCDNHALALVNGFGGTDVCEP